MDETTAKRLRELEARVRMCEAAGRAQVIITKALITTHPDPALLTGAFETLSEGAVSRVLGSPTSTDEAIRAFELFRDEWRRTLQQAMGA